MKYQIYAVDKDGKLNYAGPENIESEVTVAKCRAIEKAWRKWRREYIRRNPGNYPLKRHHKKTHHFTMHLLESNEIFVINL